MYVVGSAALRYWVGAVIVTVGEVRSIVHVELAGDGSVVPAPFLARTVNVWLPAASVPNVSGLEQDAQAPPPSLHSKVTGLWSEPKTKVGVGLLDGLAGPESIVVFGTLESIVQV